VELRQGEDVRNFSWFWIGVVLATTGLGLAAQTAQKQAPAHQTTMQPAARPSGPVDNPVADPKAIVTVGNARFTVLTPQLIRMEWSADGKFEDHASLVFINRRLPVPKFEHKVEILGSSRTDAIDTGSLRLLYTSVVGASEVPFYPKNL
jgi:alpha-glucosidase